MSSTSDSPSQQQEIILDETNDTVTIKQTENGQTVEKIVETIEELEAEGPSKSYWSFLNWRWKPTSSKEMEATEKTILSASGIKYEQKLVPITEDGHYVNTVVCGQGPPLVLLHGFAAGVAFWVGNLKSLSETNTVYAIDLPGFARSSRVPFKGDSVEEAESYFIDNIENWRKSMDIQDKMTLLGHSFGGYLSAVYSLRHPENVSHVILADPWGFPKRPDDAGKNAPLRWKVLSKVLSSFNPLATVRVAGPYGPGLIAKFRSDIAAKFEHLFSDTDVVTRYIYHSNAQNPTGESAFATLTTGVAWAKEPLVDRIHALDPNVFVTMLYGEHTWMDQMLGYSIHEQMQDRSRFHIIKRSGHHIYIDNHKDFNDIVKQELLKNQLASIDGKRNNNNVEEFILVNQQFNS